MVINGTYHEFAGDEGKMPWWKIILAPIMVFTSSQITTGIGIVVFIVPHRRNISYPRPQRRAQIYYVLGRQKV